MVFVTRRFHDGRLPMSALHDALASLRSTVADVRNSSAPPTVIGILVAPNALAQRQAVRQTWMRRHAPCVLSPRHDAPQPGKLLARFVVEDSAKGHLAAEQLRHGDLAFVEVRPPRGFHVRRGISSAGGAAGSGINVSSPAGAR